MELPMELPIFAHGFPIKTYKSATGYVTTCTNKMQKGERSFNLRPPSWKKSRPISRNYRFLVRKFKAASIGPKLNLFSHKVAQ